jgi:signal transduction histidine kinase
MRAPGHLRFEIVAGFTLIALALWAATGLLLYQAHRQAIERALAFGNNVARALAESQDSSIRTIDLALRELRAQWARNPAAFDDAVGRYEAHLKKESVVQVAIVDAEGAVRYSRLPLSQPMTFADRDYFQWQKANRGDDLHVSAPVMGRVTRRSAIQITRPLRDAAGRFAGIVVVAVPPPGLELVFHDIDLGRDGIITLARADGTILARSGSSEDADRLVSERRLQNYPLVLSVSQSRHAVLAPYRQQRTYLLAGAALATALLAAVALLLIARARERARAVEQRERLMLELHDGSIQSIYAIGLTLENARRVIERDPARAAGWIAEAGANLNLVIQDLRAFISGEPRGALSEDEFIAELERLVPPPGGDAPRFELDVDRSVVAGLDPQAALHLLRIAREAVSNIVRHAGARRARLTLQRRGDAVCLEIIDDGVGIDVPARGQLGLGLHHIQARARKLGGRASVAAASERGTRVAVEFPSRA